MSREKSQPLAVSQKGACLNLFQPWVTCLSIICKDEDLCIMATPSRKAMNVSSWPTRWGYCWRSYQLLLAWDLEGTWMNEWPREGGRYGGQGASGGMDAKTVGAKACTFLRRTEPPPRQGSCSLQPWATRTLGQWREEIIFPIPFEFWDSLW